MLRTVLIVSYWVALAVAVASLAYLLFIFGHVEPEFASHERVLTVTAVTATAAFIVGFLEWLGLPAKEGSPSSDNADRKAAGK